MTRAVKARRKRQTAGQRRAANRAAQQRHRQRESFAVRGQRLLGSDPEGARLTLKANPELTRQLYFEYGGLPESQRTFSGVTYSPDDDGDPGPEVLSSVVDLESEYKTTHRRDEIDKALVEGWCKLQKEAAEGLRQARIDHNVRDTVDQATGGGLSKTAEQWLDDLIEWCGVNTV